LHFEGVFETATQRKRVFEVVTDPNQVGRCMPGLQRLEVRSADDFDADLKLGISFIRGDFSLHFKAAERNPHSHAKLLAHGTGMGSSVDMEIEVKVTDRVPEGTSMSWTADARISGKIASLGQRLLESQAERIVEQLFICLRQRLESD
jgi:uncharacterized protein